MRLTVSNIVKQFKIMTQSQMPTADKKLSTFAENYC